MKRDIPGHAGFKATSDGKIIGKRGKEMTGYIDRCGYREVVLSENGTSKSHLAHRLIADTFIPNPHNLPFVNHKDGNKLNNSVDNLEWCTRSENTIHSYRNGLQKVATNPHGTFKVLTNEENEKIIELHKAGMIDREIAKAVGCSRELVSRKIRKAGLR